LTWFEKKNPEQSLYFNFLLLLTLLQTMPEAAGAVAAAAVADRLHGSKEDRKLAIVLVNTS
jgi:hypothetical protein